MVLVERITELPRDGFDALMLDSERAGLSFVRRLADEWASGRNRFDRPGEALFAALTCGRLIGVCGLNVDPYTTVPRVGRVRHLYVCAAHRRLGTGAHLVRTVIAAGPRSLRYPAALHAESGGGAALRVVRLRAVDRRGRLQPRPCASLI